MEHGELKNRARQFVLSREEIEAGERIDVQCAHEDLTEDSRGQPLRYKTRIAVRRPVAEIAVTLNSENGDLLSWIVPQRYKGGTEPAIDLEQAKQIAAEVVEIPDDAEIEEIFQAEQADSHISNIIWRHVVNGLEVEEDSIVVQINSKTREVISLAKIWNDVVDYEDRISAQEAEDIGKKEATKYVTGDEFDIGVADQKFIPVVDESGPQPRARIVKVWVVGITEPGGAFPKSTIFCVDCLNGDVVRVSHPKG